MIHYFAWLGDQAQSEILFEKYFNLSLVPPALQGLVNVDLNKFNFHKNAQLAVDYLLLNQYFININQIQTVFPV
jgi:hypothetical protein